MTRIDVELDNGDKAWGTSPQEALLAARTLLLDVVRAEEDIRRERAAQGHGSGYNPKHTVTISVEDGQTFGPLCMKDIERALDSRSALHGWL